MSSEAEEIKVQIWESACSLYAWHRAFLTAPMHHDECRQNMLKHAENIVRLGGVVGERKDGTNTSFPVVSYATGEQPLAYAIGDIRYENIFAGLSGAYSR